ncbi:pectin lyase-like protein [Aureobasidium pullulans]|uniref:Pectin lyase-like protein n=1 Tax=Aureobasidium pullulans TaxID=5580 RepID=A0A4S8X442_AURPU|nr:pectin lyase-like protein [Aureobasidium pullulans]
MPCAPSGYKFFRDVTEYGAVGDGITDDTAAINRAVSDGDRCGEGCGSTSVLGALVYFPPGTYLVTTPIIQYYYTQFVGNPQDPPTIKGSTNFSGIALIDTDVYIPKANGDEWYINQNQFYRQIRNFIIDLTQMPNDIVQGDQTYVPCGIHWQVAQATSLQNIVFNMPVSGQVVNSGSNSTKAVGIFQENGSGGFVSDLTFNYGNIGYRAGSQQMTARNLVFNSCLTAVSSIWNWGWVWQSITVNNCYQAFDCSNFGGIDGQGTGSMSIIDSHFNSVPYAIALTAGGPYPALYLDNLLVDGPNSHQIVFYSGHADSLLEVTQGDSLTVNGWAMGHRFQDINDEGNNTHGYISPNPKRPSSLNSNNNLFAVSRPQYASLGSGDVVNVLSKGVKNDGTGDQTSLINSILSSSVGSLVFFPAGVYIVKGTVEVPVGSKIVGSAWSQIMASGSYFEDETDPKVMFRVGKPGDSGTVELSDLMFTVQGATAGAILVEWNVKATSQGSAGMWDCHFRVGGAAKSRLQFKDCPKGASDVDPKCIAASLLMHVTKQSSGYFENIWGWTADHDLDLPVEGNTTTSTQLNVYAGRGFLIESQGPSWFYGSSVEHNVLYQYQLVGAKDIYLGCMQTETPYFQPNPPATKPFTIGKFIEDPTYPMCDSSQDNCEEAYALRILNSTIFVYGAGLYSFFFDLTQGCLTTESCQQRLVETSYSQGVWVLNLFTKGAIEVASPLGGILPVYSNDTQEQYTTEVSVWTPLGDTGADIGGYVPGNSSDGVTTDGNNTYVSIDPSVWTEEDPTIQCQPPCTFILPPFQLSTTTTITFPLYTTSLNVAWTTTVTYTDTSGRKTSSKTVTRTVQTTTLTIPAVTTTAIPYWEVPFPNPTAKDPNNTVIYVTESIQPSPFVITDDPNPERKSGVTHPLNTRTITPPPYPYSFTTTNQEPTPTNRPSSTTTSSSSRGAVVTHRTSSHTPTLVTIHTGRPSPTCRSLFGCGTRCKLFCHGPCLLNCTPHNTDWPDSNDPEPPTPPPGPPPGGEECQEGDEGCGDDEEEDEKCDASLSPGLSPFELAEGLIYCVDFKNTPTTNDDAGYLLDSTAHNRCAEPYGIEFTLANQGYTGPLPPRTIRYQLWDPWFDVVAGRKTQKVVKRVPNEPDQLMDLPPQYCLHPSPGTKIWNEALGGWANDDSNGVEYGEGSPRSDPGANGINLRCFDVPGGNPVKRDLAAASNETNLDKNAWQTRDEQHHEQDSSSSGLNGRVVQHLRSLIGLAANKLGNWHSGLAQSGVQVSPRRRTDDQPRIKGRQAVANALGLGSGGSFTDGSVYKHFVCPNDDYDPCANGDSGCDSSYAMGQYADSDYVSLDSKVYTGPTSGLGTSTGTASGPTKESSTTTKTSSIPISIVTITTTLPTPTHTPPPPTTTTTYITVDKPPPHTTADVPPPPTTTPPIFSYNNDEYPGEFEFYFHSQQQLGPNHEPFKLITGLAGFERPEGTDWEVCRMNGINLVSEKETYVGDAEVPEMKSSIATVRAYGDTCSYAEMQNEHDADEGDVVGNLTCPKLGDATCIKGTDHATACYTVFFTSLVLCSWN